MTLSPGTYVHCIECGHRELLDEGAEPICIRCEDNGVPDPYIVAVEEVTECPYQNPDDCHDENHHFGTGMHHADKENEK